jgi:hypothetical protein
MLGCASVRKDTPSATLDSRPSEAADVLQVPCDLLLRFSDAVAVEVAREGLRRVGITAASA